MHRQFVYTGKQQGYMQGDIAYDPGVPTPIKPHHVKDLSTGKFSEWDGKTMNPGRPILIHLRPYAIDVLLSRLFVEYVRKGYPSCPIVVVVPHESYAVLFQHIDNCRAVTSYSQKERSKCYRVWDLRTDPRVKQTRTPINAQAHQHGYMLSLVLGISHPNRPSDELPAWPTPESKPTGEYVCVVRHGVSFDNSRTDIANGLIKRLKSAGIPHEVIHGLSNKDVDDRFGAYVETIQGAALTIVCGESPLALVCAHFGKWMIEISSHSNAGLLYRAQFETRAPSGDPSTRHLPFNDETPVDVLVSKIMARIGEALPDYAGPVTDELETPIVDKPKRSRTKSGATGRKPGKRKSKSSADAVAELLAEALVPDEGTPPEVENDEAIGAYDQMQMEVGHGE